jgi:hypothetical protein
VTREQLLLPSRQIFCCIRRIYFIELFF